jgi:hypothetical protein
MSDVGKETEGEGQKAYPSNGNPKDGLPWDKDQIKIVSARRVSCPWIRYSSYLPLRCTTPEWSTKGT